jgi:hypothetical protein
VLLPELKVHFEHYKTILFIPFIDQIWNFTLMNIQKKKAGLGFPSKINKEVKRFTKNMMMISKALRMPKVFYRRRKLFCGFPIIQKQCDPSC